MLSLRYMDVALIPKTLLFCAGLFSVAWWPEIPAFNYRLFLVPALAVVVLSPRFRNLACMAAGVLFAASYGQNLVNTQLPVEYDRLDTVVTGQVVGLPEIQNKKIRFQFIIEQFEDSTLSDKNGITDYFQKPQPVLLSWYFPQAEAYLPLKPGDQLTLKVRLRRPRGTVNPGGFDYQLWLLRQGITATGYVRDFIKANSKPPGFRLFETFSYAADLFRYRIIQQIDQLEIPQQNRALLTALTVGSKNYISSTDWQAYARTGVIHLLVISGLHIGFAGFFGYLLGTGIGRMVNLSGDRVIAQGFGCVGSVLMAGTYALLAGWSIPTQRAFIMVAVFALGRLFARNFTSGFGYFSALFIVLLLDPLAVMDHGFWLSFIAVAVLLWLLRRRDYQENDPFQNDSPLLAKATGTGLFLWSLFKVQLVICLVIAVFLQLFNLPFSLLAPLVNMVAIPWISFLVVPLCLAGILLLPLLPIIAVFLLEVAAQLLGWFHFVVIWVSQLPLPNSDSLLPAGSLLSICLVVAGLLVVLPLGMFTRIPGLLLFIAVVFSKPDKPELLVTALDVGQGLSVVVETPGHALVYDTGPVFSDKLDAGGAIVAPYLTSRGIHRLDTLVVSHNDSDHAGGIPGLLNTISADQIIADHQSPSALAAKKCVHNDSWRWDDVTFTLINPQALTPNARYNDNNKSCILLLEYASQRILLPGDIEGSVEAPLTRYLANKLPIAVLVAPHHGSKTSSTARFVTALSPLHVVFSAGFNHHFGHPHTSVVNRYRQQYAQLHNTAETGAIQFVWRGSDLQVSGYREQVRRYWY